MRHLMVLATCTFLIAAVGQAVAGPFSPSGLARASGEPPVIFVQDKARHEGLTQKVKRAWRNLTGYKFDVSCPLSARTTCTETGKSRNDAQAKCMSRHPICWVTAAE